MQVLFDFNYLASVKTKSAIDARILVLTEPLTIEFDEVSAADAPVAVRWTERLGTERYTRFYGGRHYAPADTGYGSDAATLLREMATGNPKIEKFSAHVVQAGDERSISPDHPRIEHIRPIDREIAMAGLSDWLKRCIVVDGTMLVECAEPYYLVTREGPEVSVLLPNEKACTHWEEPPHSIYKGVFHHTDRYALKDRDNAIRDLETYHRTQGRVNIAAEPEIIQPQSLGSMDARRPLHEAARHILDATGSSGLALCHPAVLRTVVRLTELLWERDEVDVDPDELSEAIEDYRSTYDRHPPKKTVPVPVQLSTIDRALSRWSSAEITLQIEMKPVN